MLRFLNENQIFNRKCSLDGTFRHKNTIFIKTLLLKLSLTKTRRRKTANFGKNQVKNIKFTVQHFEYNIIILYFIIRYYYKIILYNYIFIIKPNTHIII